MIKYAKFFGMMLIAASLVFAGCGGGGGGGGGGDEDSLVTISAINGVTPPAYDETPVTVITETDQYTGTVAWSDSPVTFGATTVYTATITLTVKPGYTLDGLNSDFFTVAGATSVTFDADSGVVTVVFPETGVVPTKVDINTIEGVVAPVIGTTRVLTITDTAQYTGTVSWNGDWSGLQTFAGSKIYTATITLTAKSGFTFKGVAVNFFTVAGATTVTNSADSGVIIGTFPATVTVVIGEELLGGIVAYILQSGDPGYVAGEQRGLIAATSDQGTSIIWAQDAYKDTLIGTGTAIGTGSSNTDKIIAQNGSGTSYAAGLAHDYHGGGYDDWYLPSIEELKKLYSNNDASKLLTTRWYCSSSEYDASNIRYLRADNGYSDGGYPKKNTISVRAVRSF